MYIDEEFDSRYFLWDVLRIRSRFPKPKSPIPVKKKNKCSGSMLKFQEYMSWDTPPLLVVASE